MWRLTDEGVWYWSEYPEQEYVMTTTASTTRGGWTTLSSWTELASALDNFEPKPRCIFDEK